MLVSGYVGIVAQYLWQKINNGHICKFYNNTRWCSFIKPYLGHIQPRP